MPGHVKKPGQITLRMSDGAKWCMANLQDYYGLSQSGLFEMLLRDRARQAGFKIPHTVGSEIEIVAPEAPPAKAPPANAPPAEEKKE